MSTWLKKDETVIRKKASFKLPEIFSLEEARIPDSVVVEQASSAPTALYTAKIAGPVGIVADLTAGLGVNSYYFSRSAKEVIAVELDERRAEALKENFELSGVTNVQIVKSDCLEWLKSKKINADVYFVDPSRRDASKRIVNLASCVPDIRNILDVVAKKKSRLLVKASPLLDLHAVKKDFPLLSAFHLIESEGEMKELLLDFNFKIETKNDDLPINCIILSNHRAPRKFSFLFSELTQNQNINYLPGKSEIKIGAYIYMPSPAIMKSQMYGVIMESYPEMKKLSRHTQLLYSSNLFKDFPGKIFRVEGMVSSGDLKKMKGGRFSVISRNHPATAFEIENRFKLIPSDSSFLVACTVGKDKTIILTERILKD